MAGPPCDRLPHRASLKLADPGPNAASIELVCEEPTGLVVLWGESMTWNVSGLSNCSLGAINSEGWVRLGPWLDCDPCRIPLSIREADEAVTHCDSVVAAIGDPACDPRSGGIGGFRPMAAIFGVGVQQFRRSILPDLRFVHSLDRFPVSNVASLTASAEQYRQMVYAERCERLGLATMCDSGGAVCV